MITFETQAEYQAAFDTLLAEPLRELRVYDHDLELLDIDDATRHAALRALCVAGGGRRIALLLDDISRVARHPRLMQLVRDFGHVLEIRQADPDAPRPDQAFVLADRHAGLVRADKTAVRGVFHQHGAADAAMLQRSFESMWQRAPASVSATTLGL